MVAVKTEVPPPAQPVPRAAVAATTTQWPTTSTHDPASSLVARAMPSAPGMSAPRPRPLAGAAYAAALVNDGGGTGGQPNGEVSGDVSGGMVEDFLNTITSAELSFLVDQFDTQEPP